MALIVNKTATISTAQIEIRTLTVGPKQVTLSLFRQMPYVSGPLVSVESNGLRGEVWGHVNYFWYDCGGSKGLHYVVQIDDRLCRMRDDLSKYEPYVDGYGHKCPERESKNRVANAFTRALYQGARETCDKYTDCLKHGSHTEHIAAAKSAFEEHYRAGCEPCADYFNAWKLERDYADTFNRILAQQMDALRAAPQLYIAV